MIVPYGYQADASGLLVEHEGEQRVIAAVMKAKAEGLSQRKIVAKLRALGARGPRRVAQAGDHEGHDLNFLPPVALVR